MKTLFKIIGIIIALCLICLVPEFYAEGTAAIEGWQSIPIFEDSKIFYIVFGLAPIVFIILHEADVLSEVWFLDEGYQNALCFVSVCLVSRFAPTSGPLTCGISFLCCLFICIFPIYILFDEIVRFRLHKVVTNRFVKYKLVWIVMTALVVIVIALSYLLSLSGTWLPTNDYFVATFGGIWGFSMPTIIAAGIGVAFFIFKVIENLICSAFTPQPSIKTSRSSSSDNNSNNDNNQWKPPVRCCKYCKHYKCGLVNYDGRLYSKCEIHGGDPGDYHSACDHFKY
ncbi:MAG: hypothetical protein E7369_03070 [Clostridiales bacterium]|nr:hypothetical protein [Clostridiales bacterium]